MQATQPQFDPATGMTTMTQDIIIPNLSYNPPTESNMPQRNPTHQTTTSSITTPHTPSASSSSTSSTGAERVPHIYIRADHDTPMVDDYRRRNIQTIQALSNEMLAQLWFEVHQWLDSGSMPTAHYEDLMEIIDDELANRFSRNVTQFN